LTLSHQWLTMALLKRLGTSSPQETEEEGGLSRRLSQVPAETPGEPAPAPAPKPARPAPAPTTPRKEGGLLDRLAGPAAPAPPGGEQRSA
jgi:hypothetical protein